MGRKLHRPSRNLAMHHSRCGVTSFSSTSSYAITQRNFSYDTVEIIVRSCLLNHARRRYFCLLVVSGASTTTDSVDVLL